MEQPEVQRPAAPPRTRGLRLPAWLLIAAGVLALLALPLGWAKVSYPAPGPTFVVESVGHVRAGVLLGAFMVIAGCVGVVARSSDVGRPWLVAGVACGLALGAVAVFDLLTERTRVIDGLVRASTRGGVAPPRFLIQYSVRSGMILALVAAALAVVAGVLLLRAGLAGPADAEGVEEPGPS